MGETQTLIDLVEEAQYMHQNGCAQSQILDWLLSICNTYGLRMRYDEHPTEIKKTNKVNWANIPYSIIKGQFELQFGDPALHNPRNPPGCFDYLAKSLIVGRVVLSCNRKRVYTGSLLGVECNGAVIDARTWQLLAVPPRAFNLRAPLRRVNEFLTTSQYDVILANDGTIVTIYAWNHPRCGIIWCLASGNGYDVSPFKWMGDKTYAEIIYELLSTIPTFDISQVELVKDFLCKGDTRLVFKSLDHDRCYTIGFRHHNFHPLLNDPAGIWNIQTVKLTGEGANSIQYGDYGIPNISSQKIIDSEKIKCVEDLIQFGQDAFIQACSAITAGKQGFEHFKYGFILRSRNPIITGECSDLLYETPLLYEVRKLVYRRPPRKIQIKINHNDRLEYNALHAFLSTTDRIPFLQLFPQYKKRFAEYNEFINHLVEIVVQRQRQNAMAPNTRIMPVKTVIATLAQAMITHIYNHEGNINVFSSMSNDIVKDYIITPEYTALYLIALRSK
jgi:hypothetical protein